MFWVLDWLLMVIYWTKSPMEFDLKLLVWFVIKTTWHKFQLLLIYDHFEIAKINCSNTVLYSGKLFNYPALNPLVKKRWKQEHFYNGSLVFHFPEISQVNLNKSWNMIGYFILVSLSYWLGKGCNLEQKIVQLMNKLHCW